MNTDIQALIVWGASIVMVALAMEFTKAFKESKPKFWRTLSIILSAVGTLSVWFGMKHTGNNWLLPLVLGSGWLLQYGIDMFGWKKLFTLVFNGMAKKYGYEKIPNEKQNNTVPQPLNRGKEQQCVDKD